VIANPLDIQSYLVEFYNLARSVQGASKQQGKAAYRGREFRAAGAARAQRQARRQRPAHRPHRGLAAAIRLRAARQRHPPRAAARVGNVRFRIDGVLHQVYQIPTPVMAAMTSRIKVLGRMDVVEKRRPQDGRIKTRHADGEEVELRLSTMPTAFGEKLVMRIFRSGVLVRTSASSASPRRPANAGTDDRKPHGIVLVTGPTGSGKTTTLYSTLKQLATRRR
jgi:general secretion pathway protein E